MSGKCDICTERALECKCHIDNYTLIEMIEMAKNSEYGCVWYSPKGPIQITKEGKLIPINLKLKKD